MSHSAHEAVFLRQLIIELGENLPDPITIYGDNQGALALAKNPVFGERIRRLRLKEHAVRETRQEHIRVDYIPTA